MRINILRLRFLLFIYFGVVINGFELVIEEDWLIDFFFVCDVLGVLGGVGFFIECVFILLDFDLLVGLWIFFIDIV